MKEFTEAISEVTDLAIAKNITGVLFEIKDKSLRICYTDGNMLTIITEMDAEIGSDDPRGYITFDYEPLIRVVDACKATGRLQTEVINITFNTTGICTFSVERYAEMLVEKSDAEIQAEQMEQAEQVEQTEQTEQTEIKLESNSETSEMVPSAVVDDLMGIDVSEAEDTSSSNEVTEDKYKVIRRRVSTVEQSINWYAENKIPIKQKSLVRGRYDTLLHASSDEIEEFKQAKGIQDDGDSSVRLTPMNTDEWIDVRDTWDITDMQKVFSRMSAEQNLVMYVSPKANKAFVNTPTHGIMCMKFDSEVQYLIVTTTNVAKAIASLLNKLKARGYEEIYTHMIDNENMVFSVEDNRVAFKLALQPLNRNEVKLVDHKFKSDFSQYTLMFNRDAFLGSINGAKIISASDTATFSFEIDDEADASMLPNGSKAIKLVASVTNTGKSADNKYEISAAYAIDKTDDLEKVKFNCNIQMMSNIVSRMQSDYIAFDIGVEPDNNTYRIRMGEIDEEARAEIASANGLKVFGVDEIVKYRSDYLDFSIYFQASKSK